MCKLKSTGQLSVASVMAWQLAVVTWPMAWLAAAGWPSYKLQL